jgi:hypothetical protein
VLFRQGAEEQVDRRPLPARLLEFRGGDFVVADVQPPVGRDDINMIRLQWNGLSNLENGHMRAGGQDVRHLAAQIGMEMHHHDKGGASLLR